MLNGPGGPPTYPAPRRGAPPIESPGTCARGCEQIPPNSALSGEPTGKIGPIPGTVVAAAIAPGSVEALLLIHRLYSVENVDDSRFPEYVATTTFGSAVWFSCVQSPVKVNLSLSVASHSTLVRIMVTPVPP